MEMRVKRLPFLKALQTADLVVPGRTSKDIIKNVMLVATINNITLIGTDTEISLRVDVSDVISADPGECLLPTMRVLQVLNEIQDEDVTIQFWDGHVWIKSKSAEFQLMTEDCEGFPPVDSFHGGKFFTVKAADLRRLIKRTIFATDNESTRYALGGIQVEFNQNLRLTFAATDSRRLAVDSAPFDRVGGPKAPDIAPVIPQKTMKILLAIAEEEGEVQIAFSKAGICVRAGLVTLLSSLVQGRFPDWRRVIPPTDVRGKTIDFVVAPLLGAIRQTMLMRTKESRSVDFAFSKGQLRLASNIADLGESKVDLPITYEGESMRVRFDPAYVADVLKILGSASQVQLKLLGPDDPGLLVAEEYLCVIMPQSKD